MRHGTSEKKQTPQERYDQLKLRVMGAVAQNLLDDREDSYILTGHTIESHAGRRSKAIRDLGALIRYHGKNKSDSLYRVMSFDVDSPDLAVEPVWLSSWEGYYPELRYAGRHGMEMLGYMRVQELSRRESIYVHWRRDEHDRVKEGDSYYYYPRALQQKRIKAILRACVEYHFNEHFRENLESYVGIPQGALKEDPSYILRIRNVGAYSANLSAERLFGEGGYVKEYEHHIKFFQALLKNLHRLNDLVEKKGGYEEVVRRMRRASMKKLLEEAPLKIGVEPPEGPYIQYSPEVLNKEKALFILRHADLFTYEDLYADDESVLLLAEDELVDPGTACWTPAEDETRIIETYEKGLLL